MSLSLFYWCINRHKKIKWFAKDHLSNEWQNLDLNPICLQSLYSYTPYISGFNLSWADGFSCVVSYLTEVHLFTTMQETFILFHSDVSIWGVVHKLLLKLAPPLWQLCNITNLSESNTQKKNNTIISVNAKTYNKSWPFIFFLEIVLRRYKIEWLSILRANQDNKINELYYHNNSTQR